MSSSMSSVLHTNSIPSIVLPIDADLGVYRHWMEKNRMHLVNCVSYQQGVGHQDVLYMTWYERMVYHVTRHPMSVGVV